MRARDWLLVHTLVFSLAGSKLVHTQRSLAEKSSGILFRPDSRALRGAGTSGQVLLGDVATCYRTQDWVGHKPAVHSAVFNRNGTLLTSGSKDRRILMWRATSALLDKQLDTDGAAVSALVFDDQDKNVWFAGGGNNQVMHWNVCGCIGKPWRSAAV
jgi:WD40 repeat protein